MAIQCFEYTAPSHWACFAMYGEADGMDSDDEKAAAAWLASLPGPVVSVDAGENGPGFLTWHDAREFCPFAADCATYLVHIQKDS